MSVKNSINQKIRKDNILGSRRASNYIWAFLTLSGGIGFFLSGLSSYVKINLLPLNDSTQLIFVPQGITMIFYGTIGVLVSVYLWLTIIWNIGGGYNKFDLYKGKICIFRLGFPGKNRKIQLVYDLKDIKSIKISIREGLNPNRKIYLCTKDQREIPLTHVGTPLQLSQIEAKATELAKFLNVSIEGL
uniref:Photosystem I assembly protein Ycf4 n=1 Tax=Sciadococcus taiwanensis TaxID=3028030 RepID=A0A9Y1I267_9RHOD|nr:photosystem I assembly protein Ycf4 [Sciadococcus taiwanensis]